MSWLKKSVALFNVIVICLSLCPLSLAVPLTPLVQPADQNSLQEAKPYQFDNSLSLVFGGFGALKDNIFPFMMMLFQPPDIDVKENDKENLKSRFKRQSGGKFSDASKMSSTKVMQLYLQMFRNLVTSTPVGGVHPMSPESAKPIVKLFKQRIIAFFFPDVGESKV